MPDQRRLPFPEDSVSYKYYLKEKAVEKEGGEFYLDGRGYKHPDYPNGNFIAPSIIKVD